MNIKLHYFGELVLLVLALLHGCGVVCGQKTLKGNDCTGAGAYTLCQNLWGADTGVGSQTTTLDSSNGNAVAWQTKYTWANSPNNVKSYPNVNHNTARGMQLQDVASAPTVWQWNYQSASDDLRADVAYDIWFGVPQAANVASAQSSYEIMIWLSSRGGIGGIGSVVAQNLQLGGHTWTLKHGPNANWDVFSFITAEGDITDFNADLNDFFKYLIKEQGVAKTQFIHAIQAGSEPFTGSATLVTSNYSVDVSTGAPTPVTHSSAAKPTSTDPDTSAPSSTKGNKNSSNADPTSTASGVEPPDPQDPSTTPTAPMNGPTQGGTGGGKCRLQRPSSAKLRREKLSQ